MGRPRLQYLKQVARNTAADSYTAMEINGLQQFQMESCQPIKRLEVKKQKLLIFRQFVHHESRQHRNTNSVNATGDFYFFASFVPFRRPG